MKPLDCIHVDTCLPCYFAGSDMPLICVPVWRNMTRKALRYDLRNELHQGVIEGEFYGYDNDQFYFRAIAAINRIAYLKGKKRLFADLQDGDNEKPECNVYAYFVFKERD